MNARKFIKDFLVWQESRFLEAFPNKDFLLGEDLEAIDQWPEEDCIKVAIKLAHNCLFLNRIQDSAEERLSPFCIKHLNCKGCAYAANRNISDCTDTDWYWDLQDVLYIPGLLLEDYRNWVLEYLGG